MKATIAGEERYRLPYEDERDKWAMRLMINVAGNSTMIMNADGIDGNHKSVDTLIADFGGIRVVDKLIETYTRTIRRSRYKEKFFRYAYNKDIVNAEKYSAKWTAEDTANFEDIEETLDDDGGVAVVSITGGEVDETGKQSQGVILMGKERKRR